MNYRVRRQGAELGTFTLEELRRRRAAGEFTGTEYVQGEGRPDWQPLDLVLRHGLAAIPISAPGPQLPKGPNQKVIWGIIAVAIVLVAIGIGMGAYQATKVFRVVRSATRAGIQSGGNSDALTAAKKPVTWTTNTMTADDVNRRAKEFRVRQWIEGYKERGRHDQPWDAEATQLIQAWINGNYGGTDATNRLSARELGEKLAKEPGCDDPLVLTVAAVNSGELHEKYRLLELAVKGFEQSKHRAYPKFYALVLLAGESRDPARLVELDHMALMRFEEGFKDGSFAPMDQAEIAEILVHNWGRGLFDRNPAMIFPIVKRAGKNFEWLALVLEGEYHIKQAWQARGSGYVNTVTQQGWKQFSDEMAAARNNLTKASDLRPELPLAPARMIYVCLGDSDITEMRLWFDRAVGAQIDYASAWSDLRWGMRPRWYGDEDAMLALGVTAVNTGRFDTDVPRMFYDAVTDVESEMKLQPGEHIYGREDVWPHLQRLYEGYISATAEKWPSSSQGWRSTYAVMAYYAQEYDICRAQFDALNWQPQYDNFGGWDIDLSLLPEEIAARTGPVGATVARAESSRESGDVTASLALYRDLNGSTNADSRSREFIRCRLASLEQEQRLQKGEWIDLQPKDEHDPNWVFSRGKARVLPDGALEVESGPEGHLFYSRVRVGPQFEVKGEFEVVRSSTHDFQAGLVMGLPDFKGYYWNSFRMKRNDTEGRVASFAYGWGRQEVSRRVSSLQNDRNTFDFKLEDSKATASLNGKPVIENAAQPRALRLNDDAYLLGLGAFNDVNDTVIRYRNVQVRRITPATKDPKQP